MNIQVQNTWIVYSLFLVPFTCYIMARIAASAKTRVTLAAVTTVCLLSFGLAASTPIIIIPTIDHKVVGHHIINLADDSGSESTGYVLRDADTNGANDESRNMFNSGIRAFEGFFLNRDFDQIAVTMISDDALVLTNLSPESRWETFAKLRNYKPRYAGTNLAKGIRSAIDQFKADDGTAPRVLILNTDGIDDIAPAEAKSMAIELASLSVKVYWIKEANPYFSADLAKSADSGLDDDLTHFISTLHGRKFVTTTEAELEGAYAQVGELAPATVKSLATSISIPLALFFLVLGLTCFAIGSSFAIWAGTSKRRA